MTLILALVAFPVAPGWDENMPVVPAAPRASVPRAVPEDAFPDVWAVETTKAYETFSNGLRIDDSFVVSNKPRSYEVIARNNAAGGKPALRSTPAGIVYHTTESRLFDFQAQHNGQLRAASRGLLDYVRRNLSYHFVIDRFRQVYRVVQETDAANHSGWSVWADQDYIYLNLNESFLGIAFEAQNRAQDGFPSVNTAQMHAGRILTEELRAKYRIKARNCVAHAQVSISPGSWRIGYHTDWAVHLPFLELGLPDNYEQALPSVYLFGFGYAAELNDPSEEGLGKGIRAAETRLIEAAACHGITVEQYRQSLRQQYREIIRTLESLGHYKREKPVKAGT